jgi:hypothetical protein
MSKDMKNLKKINLITLLAISIFASSCNWLEEVEPKNKIPMPVLFSDAGGIKTYMANLYYNLPIEDFNYTRSTFNREVNNDALWTHQFTDEAPHKNGGSLLGAGDLKYFANGYTEIRNICLMKENLATTTLSEADKKIYLGECYFLMAYTYFALVKRCGGVPYITKVQQYDGSNIEALKVPRMKEKDTWDSTLALCDSAIKYLPIRHPQSSRRAGSDVAWALKSRVALHAASVAKFFEEAAPGGATDAAIAQGLVGGMSMADANNYYNQCIEASLVLMNSGRYSLYAATPSTPEEAEANLLKMYTTPSVASSENIFVKGYSTEGDGHSWNMQVPAQIGKSYSIAASQPTLDWVENYEDYTDNNSARFVKLGVYTSGVETTIAVFNKNTNYKHYAHPMDIFNGTGPIGAATKPQKMDARLFAQIVLPGSKFSGVTINFQGGLIKTDGASIEGAVFTPVNKAGVDYYPMGGASESLCSGWDAVSGKNGTSTGFLMRKFMNETDVINNQMWGASINDWVDLRYAEVLLNYAEATVENKAGYGSQVVANNAINALRRRAGHKDNVVATANVTTTTAITTLGTVQRERNVEMAFENKRVWDLIRRREFHKVFNAYRYSALKLYQDLRTTPVSYFYIRTYSTLAQQGKTFENKLYYRSIDGVASNGLVQNPGY